MTILRRSIASSLSNIKKKKDVASYIVCMNNWIPYCYLYHVISKKLRTTLKHRERATETTWGWRLPLPLGTGWACAWHFSSEKWTQHRRAQMSKSVAFFSMRTAIVLPYVRLHLLYPINMGEKKQIDPQMSLNAKGHKSHSTFILSFYFYFILFFLFFGVFANWVVHGLGFSASSLTLYWTRG